MAWPTAGANRLIDAMVHAEGGPDAFVKAVRCSMPCTDYAHAREIAANTIAHALWDAYMEIGDAQLGAFVRFLGARWAPVGVSNDPTNLNANWVPNVLEYLKKYEDT